MNNQIMEWNGVTCLHVEGRAKKNITQSKEQRRTHGRSGEVVKEIPLDKVPRRGSGLCKSPGPHLSLAVLTCDPQGSMSTSQGCCELK